MKFGNLVVIRLPFWKDVIGVIGVPGFAMGSWAREWYFAVARIDEYSHSNAENAEDSYKIYLTPVDKFEDNAVERAWYAHDMLRPTQHFIKEFEPSDIKNAIALADELNKKYSYMLAASKNPEKYCLEIENHIVEFVKQTPDYTSYWNDTLSSAQFDEHDMINKILPEAETFKLVKKNICFKIKQHFNSKK